MIEPSLMAVINTKTKFSEFTSNCEYKVLFLLWYNNFHHAYWQNVQICYTSGFLPLCRSLITQYRCDYCKLEYLLGYFAAAACIVAQVTVAAEYPQSTLKGTPSHSSHSGNCIIWNLCSWSEESGCVLSSEKKKQQQQNNNNNMEHAFLFKM